MTSSSSAGLLDDLPRMSGAMSGYRMLNLQHCDERAQAQAGAPDHAWARFREDPDYISRAVAFDIPLLEDIVGVRGVHLQCHIGTETVSLARLGARMTGVDFSRAAIEASRRLAKDAGVDVDFVQADVYDASGVLAAGEFDLVFTGINALCWLPDIWRWAAVIADLLRPGGRLFIREAHPMLWALDDDRDDDLLMVKYPYFERQKPVLFSTPDSCPATGAVFKHNTTYRWNHGLGEIINAILDHDLRVTSLIEHDSIPWEALPGQMDRLSNGEWRLSEKPWRLPHSYTLQAVKPGS
jgi:2-polyprenyl-3-methyl-5-hydroxy-6-metoxy-1,4-benzoquinol methylase